MLYLPPHPRELTNIAQIIFFSKTSDGTLWSGGWGHGPQGIVCRSIDDGKTWEWLPSIYKITGDDSISVPRFYDLVKANDGTLILASQLAPDNVCWASTDEGKTWQMMGPLAGAWEALCLLKTRDGTIYAGTSPHGDVFKYTLPVHVEVKHIIKPDKISLFQNYPNPFNSSTTIRFEIPIKGKVTIRVYDILGCEIKTIFEKELESGIHSVDYDGTDAYGNEISSGIYFYRITIDTYDKVKKFIVLK